MKACKIFNLYLHFILQKWQPVSTILYHLLNDNYTQTSYVGHTNIKSCLPDRSEIPDHGKTVFFFLHHPFWAKKKTRKIPVKNE